MEISTFLTVNNGLALEAFSLRGLKKVVVKFLICFIFLWSTNPAVSLAWPVIIHSLDQGKNHEPSMAFLSNGRIAYFPNQDSALYSDLLSLQKKQHPLEITLDRSNHIISLQLTDNKKSFKEGTVTRSNESEFHASFFKKFDHIQEVFNRMREDYQEEAQCYNMAHIWAYEEFQRSSLKTMKLFLFFSKKYIRTYKYHWWFHVTPLTYLKVKRRTYRPYTLDRRYTFIPLEIEEWKNHFIIDQHSCKEITKYAEYKNNQSEYCFLLPTSMYFWQPKDILNRDRTGFEKTQFIKEEIQHAYLEAF
jgi:hypothetical protein